MARMPKCQIEEFRQDSIKVLQKYIDSETKVFTLLRHSSGMNRSVSLMIVIDKEDIWVIDHLVASAVGRDLDEKHGGVKIGQNGAHLGQQLVRELCEELFPGSGGRGHMHHVSL